ncbi:MAG: thiol peroxidase [Chloroflexota bacterium]
MSNQGRHGAVTFQGNPLTVRGEQIAVGDKAPEFTLIGNDMTPVTLSDSSGKVRLISVVPSLDTGICDAQTRRFNEEAGRMADNVIVLTVSADLPFAQARWCGAAGVDKVTTLSDHKDMNFGQAYGTHIDELRVEQRAIFVIDAEDTVRYAEYVPEIAQHPDYDAALDELKRAL